MVIGKRRWYSGSREQLRILFFGSDNFSTAHAKALMREKRCGISALEVATNESKYSGRGMRRLKDTPLKQWSLSQGIKVHTVPEDDKNWTIPLSESERLPFNLILVVSFGRLLPSHVLGAVNYSFNLHPSALPRHRGSMPLQSAILSGDSWVRCSIQTLHPSKFDRGNIVRQSQRIAVLKDDTIDSLIERVTPCSTQFLLDFIEHRQFEPISHPSGTEKIDDDILLTKKSVQATRVDWQKWTASEVSAWIRAFRKLKATSRALKTQREDEVVLSGIVPTDDITHAASAPGSFYPARVTQRDGTEIDVMAIVAKHGSVVAVTHITVASKRKVRASEWAKTRRHSHVFV